MSIKFAAIVSKDRRVTIPINIRQELRIKEISPYALYARCLVNGENCFLKLQAKNSRFRVPPELANPGEIVEITLDQVVPLPPKGTSKEQRKKLWKDLLMKKTGLDYWTIKKR